MRGRIAHAHRSLLHFFLFWEGGRVLEKMLMFVVAHS